MLIKNTAVVCTRIANTFTARAGKFDSVLSDYERCFRARLEDVVLKLQALTLQGNVSGECSFADMSGLIADDKAEYFRKLFLELYQCLLKRKRMTDTNYKKMKRSFY